MDALTKNHFVAGLAAMRAGDVRVALAHFDAALANDPMCLSARVGRLRALALGGYQRAASVEVAALRLILKARGDGERVDDLLSLSLSV